jgi:hypothetical protein
MIYSIRESSCGARIVEGSAAGNGVDPGELAGDRARPSRTWSTAVTPGWWRRSQPQTAGRLAAVCARRDFDRPFEGAHRFILSGASALRRVEAPQRVGERERGRLSPPPPGLRGTLRA